ncbi:hypothetical protein OsI_14723 [Oryza sativa Indica Group]|uniref:DUF4220 domain-containing protein n=1 Tax=Oryza sativa subsp. indica TaxID=39946 RepID=B8AV19_ORYSI|nr:hypothetical protein OsI_14723 [Oryza sativa Indica Group]
MAMDFFHYLMDVWKKWGIQILVTWSLMLQVILLLLAGTRRRHAPAMLRFLLWLAYLLADSTAIYALGHLSLGSVASDHRLASFWAPFLLLHLSGPDNITAYALQDSELWLRHLQILLLQLLGASYVLYKHIIIGDVTTRGHEPFLLANVLMFVVGLFKYGERIHALRCNKLSNIWSSPKEVYRNNQLLQYLQDRDHRIREEEELSLQYAHSLHHICKRGIVDFVIEEPEGSNTKILIEKMLNEKDRKTHIKMWKVIEMELSLMYDILYTKAGVIHSWFGYSIRVLSPVTIFASFLLFILSGRGGSSCCSKAGQQHGIDIAVTYVLLVGAFLMETTSLINALASSWALGFLYGMPWSWLENMAFHVRWWHRLRRSVLALRRSVEAKTRGFWGRSRKWSGNIGQFNLLYFRAAQVNRTNYWLGKCAMKLGFGIGNWWNNTCYSWTIMIPDKVKTRSVGLVSKRHLNTMGLLSTGDLHGVDFHESIIIWHIATDLILLERKRNYSGGNSKNDKEVERVRSIRALSNYLMFLVVTRPDMVPGLPQNWLYQQTCNNLDEICEDRRYQLLSSAGGKANNIIFRVLRQLFRGHNDNTASVRLNQTNELAKILLEKYNPTEEFDRSVPRLTYACNVAHKVLNWEYPDDLKDTGPVKVLHDLWMDFLIYAANRCNRKSHAEMLNVGGEFTTVVWLMIEHIYQTKRDKNKS